VVQHLGGWTEVARVLHIDKKHFQKKKKKYKLRKQGKKKVEDEREIRKAGGEEGSSSQVHAFWRVTTFDS
jgi:lipocalin